MNSVIQKRFRDHTVVSVAHKLDFATKFDRIIVMEDGRIVEFERPGELLSRASKFKALHSAQLQGME